MRLPKRVCFAFLLFLICLNLIVRYPRTPHELDYDGFIFHGMIRFLVSDGYARWIIHPLSYFGLYPLSHPGGGLFLVGSLTQVSEVPIEGSILLLDSVVVIVGLLGAFALSMELRKNELLALLVSAAFSLAPTYVAGLMWSVPARTLSPPRPPAYVPITRRPSSSATSVPSSAQAARKRRRIQAASSPVASRVWQ